MESVFLLILILTMIIALASGFPVAFSLPGSAVLTILMAALAGYLFANNPSEYFHQDGPIQWLSAGITNFRAVYWEVERDTLIAIPLFIFTASGCAPPIPPKPAVTTILPDKSES